MQMKRRQQGLSIWEALLAIAAGAMLIVIGLRQYQSYQQYAELERLKQNVDMIFQAMNAYYKANCFAQYNRTSNTYTFGLLMNGGSGQPNVNNTIPININSNLRGMPTGIKYMADVWPLPSNLINTTIGQNGYIAQFNKYTYPAFICIDGVNITGPSASQGCITSTQIGTVVVWKPQVSVRAQVAAKARAYANMAGANCLSNVSGQTVTSCATPTVGNYLVWERMPIVANEGVKSSYSSMIPSVNAFTRLYRSPGITYLIGTQSTAVGSNINYISCGY